ncbi:MAG: hypothetical protein HYY65_00035 [Candidatus Tectomicrobia bacterium]|uniref:Uncharacterized protein n=1 Tax=Tectimicrobiota bacterium TaxID=2528274 RepID=A0A932LZ65_UNCTE|nr:hypothetical protein [Candidatus Tectomicrobia bacterium]
MRRQNGWLVCAALFLALAGQGWLATPVASFTAQEIVSLKRAGISEEVIALMVEKRSDVMGLLSAQDALTLRAGGVGDPVLRALLSPTRQGGSLQKFLPVEGIVRLKEAGVGDDLLRYILDRYLEMSREEEAGVSRVIVDQSGRRVIVYGDREPSPRLKELEEKLKESRAWELLKTMGLIVDKRP